MDNTIVNTIPVNDAPVFTAVRTRFFGLEDQSLPLTGLSLQDPDADVVVDGMMTMRVSVADGGGFLSAIGPISSSDSRSFWLTATLETCNRVLSSLVFKGGRDAYGHFTVRYAASLIPSFLLVSSHFAQRCAIDNET